MTFFASLTCTVRGSGLRLRIAQHVGSGAQQMSSSKVEHIPDTECSIEAGDYFPVGEARWWSSSGISPSVPSFHIFLLGMAGFAAKLLPGWQATVSERGGPPTEAAYPVVARRQARRDLHHTNLIQKCPARCPCAYLSRAAVQILSSACAEACGSSVVGGIQMGASRRRSSDPCLGLLYASGNSPELWNSYIRASRT